MILISAPSSHYIAQITVFPLFLLDSKYKKKRRTLQGDRVANTIHVASQESAQLSHNIIKCKWLNAAGAIVTSSLGYGQGQHCSIRSSKICISLKILNKNKFKRQQKTMSRVEKYGNDVESLSMSLFEYTLYRVCCLCIIWNRTVLLHGERERADDGTV